MSNKEKYILITGSSGALGSEIVKLIKSRRLLTPSSKELDLTSQESINNYFKKYCINTVIHCASIVGGISFNISNRYEIALVNSLINTNILDACHRYEISKLITMGSSCCYPTNAKKPFDESSYIAGPLEKTNLNYALTKLLMSEAIKAHNDKYKTNYKTVILCNLFSPPTKAKEDRLHLINAIINKMLNYKSNPIIIGGSGKPRREFLDTLSAAKFINILLDNYDFAPNHINCGNTQDFTVFEYYSMIADIFKINPIYQYDPNIPDGVLTKKLNINKALSMGWHPEPIKNSLENLISNII